MKKVRGFGVILALLSAAVVPVSNSLGQGQGVIILMSKPANAGQKTASPEPTMPPARNPEIAVAEEYEIARRRGTAEALELFIARHPESSLAAQARSEFRQMKK